MADAYADTNPYSNCGTHSHGNPARSSGYAYIDSTEADPEANKCASESATSASACAICNTRSNYRTDDTQ
jgi:hypothetical protein